MTFKRFLSHPKHSNQRIYLPVGLERINAPLRAENLVFLGALFLCFLCFYSVNTFFVSFISFEV